MSNFLKKSFLISMVAMVALMGITGVVGVASAEAVAGDLIKGTTNAAVYYLDSNNIKHPFNHAREYFTWYDGFDSVKTVSTDEMAGYDTGNTVVLRAGARLVQFPDILADGTFNTDNNPQVYAVGPEGVLYHIDSADVAVALYGSAWESMIVAVPVYLKGFYTNNGDTLTADSNYPNGTLVKTASDSTVYYIEDGAKRPVTDEGMTVNMFNMDYVLTVDDLTGYTDGTSVTDATGMVNAGSGSGTSGGTTTTGSGLTVALAATTPGSQVAPRGATNVPLMKFNLTASADGAVTLSTLSVKRLGVGSTSQYDYLYLYDGANRLTNGKTLNSTTHVVSFVNVNLTVPAGTTKTLTLSADMSSTNYAGQISYFQINSADLGTTATVNGTFPLLSSVTTFGSSASGSVTVAKDGTLSNPAVGQNDVKIAQFKLTAGTGEDLNISRLTLYQAGTLNNNYLTDLKLYQNAALLATTASVTAKGYVVFDLSASPFVLSKNTNRVFYVTGDVSTSGRNDDTIRTYIDQTTDVYAVGATYGYGATVDIGATSGTYDGTSSSNYSEVTVQGGQITVAMNGPVTGDLAIGSDNVTLLQFAVTAGVNAEIRSMRIELHKTSTDLDTDTGSDCASGTDYIANVKVVDADNGESTSAVNCGSFSEVNDSDAGIYTTYTDYFTLTAGETRNFEVRADLNSSLTAGTYYANLGSSLTTLYAFASTGIKNTENNQYVTDIVPTTYVQGNNQTVAAAGLRVALASNQVGTTVVQGTRDVTIGEFAMEALSGSDVTISGISLYGYVSTSTTDGKAAVRRGLATGDLTTFTYFNNLVSNARIYDKTADPSMTTNLNSTVEGFASATGLVTFNNVNWTIPAGETHVMAVVVDVSNSAYTNVVSTDKYVKVNFADNTAITAVDSSNNTVTMTNSTGGAFVITSTNGAAANIVTDSAYLVLTDAGTLNVTAEDNPAIANVVAGTSDVPVLNLKFQAVNEAFNVNKLNIEQTHTDSYDRSVNTVTISYKNAAGNTVTATQSLIAGEAKFNITANPLYVPSNTYRIVSVYYNLNSINQNQAAYTGDIVRATFDTSDSFEAKGAGSSSTSLTNSSNNVDVTGNDMTVHGTIPTITADTTTNVTMTNGPIELYRWQVSAAEGTDLTLKKLSFKMGLTDSVIAAGNATMTLTNFQVYEGTSYANVAVLTQSDTASNGYAVYTGFPGSAATTTTFTGTNVTAGGKISAATGKIYHNIAGDGALGASASSSHNIFVVFNDDRLVSGGSSKYFILKTTASNVNIGANSDDSGSMYMFDGDTATTAYKYLVNCDSVGPHGISSKYCLGDVAAGTNDTATYMVWSDSTGTAGNNTHTDTTNNDTTASSADWFNGYKIKTLDVVRSLN